MEYKYNQNSLSCFLEKRVINCKNNFYIWQIGFTDIEDYNSI